LLSPIFLHYLPDTFVRLPLSVKLLCGAPETAQDPLCLLPALFCALYLVMSSYLCHTGLLYHNNRVTPNMGAGVIEPLTMSCGRMSIELIINSQWSIFNEQAALEFSIQCPDLTNH
jgi:hypothetical protein